MVDSDVPRRASAVFELIARRARHHCHLANAVLVLLAHPDARARVQHEPALYASVADEVLRLRSPVQVSLTRMSPRRRTPSAP